MATIALTSERSTVRAGTLRNVMASEWIKLASVRSYRWTLVAFAVCTVALGVVVSATGHSNDPTNQSLAGLAFGELAMGVLGVLTITGEYSSGSIRSTLVAVPNRPLVLAAKALVYGATALVVSEAVTLVTFLAGQAAMSQADRVTLGQPGVASAVILSGLYLPLIGLFGLGLGAIVRSTAAGVGIFAALVLVLPIALAPFGDQVGRFAPELILKSSVAAVVPQPGFLSPLVGFGVMAAYATLTLLAGLVVFARRDA